MSTTTLADAPEFRNGDSRCRALATPSLGTVDLAVWRVDMPPGSVGKEHTLDREEVFIVETGRLAVTLNGSGFLVDAGGAVIVPPHTPFCASNGSDTEPATLIGCAPAGITATLDALTVTPPWTA
ncbi:cupin domain-containing protein [Nocardia sp. NPDC058058]|uniref:cupin domain-containing protein n=1 Tax=Nocardia sp. NPDC058058 TaxID=3346317 RepID=UPI0036D8EDC1